ncbi:hypothetical protein ACFPRL_25945 [Pseudoclavibacter helvolus]
MLERLEDARVVGLGAETLGECVTECIHCRRRRQQGLDIVRSEEGDALAHRSTNPGVISSRGSTSKTCSPVLWAMPET